MTCYLDYLPNHELEYQFTQQLTWVETRIGGYGKFRSWMEEAQ